MTGPAASSVRSADSTRGEQTAADTHHAAEQPLTPSTKETPMDSSRQARQAREDHEFVVAAHAGELGEQTRVAADGAILDALDHGYENDSSRVAATIRAFLDS